MCAHSVKVERMVYTQRAEVEFGGRDEEKEGGDNSTVCQAFKRAGQQSCQERMRKAPLYKAM